MVAFILATAGNVFHPMAIKPTLSVVIPTYNCAPHMERHLASVAKWVDLADEIIVVDSRSTDGTLELIRSRLEHPNLRIIKRDRGLYASWNEGIAATTGDWIYVSTAGDLIGREHLARLLAAGVGTNADVVVSPQRFVDETGEPIVDGPFVNPAIHAALAPFGQVVVPPLLVRLFAFRKAKPNALLGSCASDLFKGSFLRARPFPTDYGTHGDTAWTLRHSGEMSLCLVPVAGADFCIHTKEPVAGAVDLKSVLDQIFLREARGELPAAHAALAALALGTRMAAIERSKRWRQRPRTISNWRGFVSAAVRYLWLRARLQRVEAKLERALLAQLRPGG